MISSDFKTAKAIPKSQVDAAAGIGWKPASKMIGTKGEVKWIPNDQVDAARNAKEPFQLHPDSGQKMVTPDGKITYALPEEVDKFKASGHTKIMPDGRFEIQALPGEDQADTYKRAANVAKALGPQQMEKSKKAEEDWWTSKEGLKDEGKGLANVGLTVADTLGTITGGSELAAAGKAGLKALGRTEVMQLMRSSPKLYAEWLIKNPAARKAVADIGLKSIKGLGYIGGAYEAGKWLYKAAVQ